jgi:hypothetical protein
MVVPIYKKWEASTVRLQIVQQETMIQLLAFFEDYSHTDAMAFPLKTTDIFELVEKSGKQAVKLVDAKFPLPPEVEKGRPRDVTQRFVCLDMPEYPDDITVGFNSEAGKWNLPGSTSPQTLLTMHIRTRPLRCYIACPCITRPYSERLPPSDLSLSTFLSYLP